MIILYVVHVLVGRKKEKKYTVWYPSKFIDDLFLYKTDYVNLIDFNGQTLPFCQ